MTNKEASATLEVFHEDILNGLWLTNEQRKGLAEALDLAIKALEKDKCSSCKHYDKDYGETCLNPEGTCRVFEYDGYEEEEKMNNDEKTMKIADHYGMESQIDILQEECAELVQAVSKYKRGKDDDFSHLLEEMADVTIMIEQVLYLLNKRTNMFGISAYDGFYDFIDKKLDRQIKRIEDEG